MPPRKHLDIAAEPRRRDLLREYMLTEAEMTRLCKLPLDEALWRIRHETDVHIKWSRERRAFVERELRRHHRPSQRANVELSALVVIHQPQPRGSRLA